MTRGDKAKRMGLGALIMAGILAVLLVTVIVSFNAGHERGPSDDGDGWRVTVRGRDGQVVDARGTATP